MKIFNAKRRLGPSSVPKYVCFGINFNPNGLDYARGKGAGSLEYKVLGIFDNNKKAEEFINKHIDQKTHENFTWIAVDERYAPRFNEVTCGKIFKSMGEFEDFIG
jgi:hypothetical protein